MFGESSDIRQEISPMRAKFFQTIRKKKNTIYAFQLVRDELADSCPMKKIPLIVQQVYISRLNPIHKHFTFNTHYIERNSIRIHLLASALDETMEVLLDICWDNSMQYRLVCVCIWNQTKTVPCIAVAALRPFATRGG